MNFRKIGMIAILIFTVFCSAAFLADIVQRHAGNLRSQTATAAHVELQPAYLHDGAGVTRSAFNKGELLFVHENYKKLQSCHMTISNVFVNRQSGFIYRGETYLSWVRQDAYNLSENIELPRNIIPGTYRFIRKTVSFCGGDQVYYTTNFDLPFTLN